MHFLDESIVSQSGNLTDSAKKSRQAANVRNDQIGPPHAENNGSPGDQATLPTVNREENRSSSDQSASNGLTLQVEQLNTMSQPELIDMLTEMVGLFVVDFRHYFLP